MGCLEEGSKSRRVCDETRDDGYSQCDTEEDQGYSRCTQTRDDGYRDCCTWVPCSWFCDAWVWVSNIVCVAWTWVSHIVCVAWTWISHIVCVAWSYVVETVCLVYVGIKIFIGTLFGSSRRVDVHCHLMTARSVAIYVTVGFVEALVDFNLALNGAPTRRNRDLLVRDVEEGDISNTIAQLRECVRIFMLRDGTEVYRELRKTYLWQYKVVPLTLDLGHFSQGYVSSLIRTLDEAATNLNATIARMTPGNILELQSMLNEAVGEIRNHLLAHTQAWNYAGQAAEQLEVAKRYPNNVFPFLGVDPRRQGILNIVKESVSRNGPFYGVKLYTPIGFSPTDPILFGGPDQKDCVYRYCESNGIPITVHCSPGGFGTLSGSVPVDGLVQFGEGVQLSVDGFKGTVDNEGLAEVIGTVNFSTSIYDEMNVAVAERSRALNHPHIWRRVLNAYPRLYLNLAHFGGQEEATAYAQEIESGVEADPIPWTKHIVAIMESFENVYSDLACFANGTDLQLFKDQVYDRVLPDRLKARVLYGSDFNILMLFEVSVADYLDDFQRIFGSAFDAISIDNPQRFLFDRP